MKKFLLSSLIALTGSTLSIHAFANSEKEVISDQPLLSVEEKKEMTDLRSNLKIASLSDRLKSKESLRNDANQRLAALKTPDQKLSFVMSLNNTLDGKFHVNDDYALDLNYADKSYFDAYYTKVLVSLSKQINSKEELSSKLIADYEKIFPFKIYQNDLEKILQNK